MGRSKIEGSLSLHDEVLDARVWARPPPSEVQIWAPARCGQGAVAGQGTPRKGGGHGA